jgi:hypothetical protein
VDEIVNALPDEGTWDWLAEQGSLALIVDPQLAARLGAGYRAS